METGVYCIRNKRNGKRYVGSSTVSVRGRWKSHRNGLRKNLHTARHLQHAWNKYGEQLFEFLVLEFCDPETCLEREQFWMDEFRSADPRFGYNQSPTAGNNSGTKMPEAAKKRIARAAKLQWESEEHRATVSAKVSATLTGRKLSAESLAKRTMKQRPILIARNKSQSMRNRVSRTLLGHIVSQETKDKIAASLRGRKLSGETKQKISEHYHKPESRERSRAGARKQWDNYTLDQRQEAINRMLVGLKKAVAQRRYNRRLVRLEETVGTKDRNTVHES